MDGWLDGRLDGSMGSDGERLGKERSERASRSGTGSYGQGSNLERVEAFLACYFPTEINAYLQGPGMEWEEGNWNDWMRASYLDPCFVVGFGSLFLPLFWMYLVSYDWVMNAPLRTIQIQRQNDARLVFGVLCRDDLLEYCIARFG
jgi:hypothetical protein